MFERRIEIRPGQRLTLTEMAGSVRLAVWDEAEAQVRLPEGDEHDLAVEMAEGGPSVSAQRACEVNVPHGIAVVVRQALADFKAKGVADLNVEQVRGNLKLTEVGQAVVAEVYGHLKADEVETLRLVGTVYGEVVLDEVQMADLQNVRGNVRAKESVTLRVSRVSGNLQAKKVARDLDIDQVGGNVFLKEMGGPVTLDQVAGNLAARDLAGGAKVDRVGGNLMFSGKLAQGRSYRFKVDGNALLKFDEPANAHLRLAAQGRLLCSLKLSDEQREGGVVSGTLGDGGAELGVDAGGNILLGGGRGEVDAALGEDVARRVEEAMQSLDLEDLGRQVSQEMESAMARLRVKMEGMDWERLGRRAQEAVERAMERLQVDADRWAERASRHQEWLERRAEREARRAERWQAHTRRAAAASAAAATAASEEREVADFPGEAEREPSFDEERLSILRMVEQGQITPQEAEMLLNALE